MDARNEVREFLTSRRARMTPEQAGVISYGKRRVKGLRRDEVAHLAGVSVDYYTRMERGNLRGVSDDVLNAVCRALRMSDDERTHLFALARSGGARRQPARRRGSAQPLRPGIMAVVDGLGNLPVTVTDGLMNVVATNSLGRALYKPLFDAQECRANQARFAFLDPRAKEFWTDWDSLVVEVVGALRTAAARNPYDRDLTDLIGELATRSETFRQMWAGQDVYVHRGGAKRINHPQVGRLELTYEFFRVDSAPDVVVIVYVPEPGSASSDAVTLLSTVVASTESASQP